MSICPKEEKSLGLNADSKERRGDRKREKVSSEGGREGKVVPALPLPSFRAKVSFAVLLPKSQSPALRSGSICGAYLQVSSW